MVVALLLASALALVDARPAAAAEACFPQTNHCVRGRFLDQWQNFGGLAINGYPLTDERMETLEDGKQYLVLAISGPGYSAELLAFKIP